MNTKMRALEVMRKIMEIVSIAGKRDILSEEKDFLIQNCRPGEYKMVLNFAYGRPGNFPLDVAEYEEYLAKCPVEKVQEFRFKIERIIQRCNSLK